MSTSHQKRKLFSLIAASSLLFAAACGGGSGDAGSEIKIALIDPVTGTAAQYGEDIQRGQLLAIKEINAKGGVNGQNLKATTYDDQNLPEQAVTLARRAINEDGVKFIVGTNGSSVAMAVRNVTQPAHVIYMAATSKGNDVTDKDHDYVFRFNSTPDMDKEFLLDYVDDTLAPKRIGIVQEQSDYGVPLADGVEEHFGDRVAGKVVTQLSTTNFSPFISKLAADRPDAIFMANGGSASALAASTKQLFDSGLTVPKIFPPGTISDTLFELAGNEALEGAVAADVYSPTLDTEVNAEFVDAYEAEHGEVPSVHAMIGYEQILVLAQAIEDAGTADDTAKVRDAIRAGTYETPRGTLTFNEIGQAIPESGLIPLKIENGEVVLNDAR